MAGVQYRQGWSQAQQAADAQKPPQEAAAFAEMPAMPPGWQPGDPIPAIPQDWKPGDPIPMPEQPAAAVPTTAEGACPRCIGFSVVDVPT